MKFHINSNGFAAPCHAVDRACPRDATGHYDSMEDAAMARLAMDSKQAQNHTPHAPPRVAEPSVEFGKYEGQPLATMLADRRYCGWLLQQDWFASDHPQLFKQVRDSFKQDDLRKDFNAIGRRVR